MFNSDTLLAPFHELWAQVSLWFPKLLVALVILIIGFFVARVVYKTIVKLFGSRLDAAIRPLVGAVERSGYHVKVGHVVGWILKWFIIIAVVLLSLDILELSAARELLVIIVGYIPKVIGAIIVLLGGFVLADFVKKITKASTKMLNIKSSSMLATLARTAIIVFSFLAAMSLLGIGDIIINALVIGFVTMIALAGGLAFGLGGRDAASKAIEEAKHALHK
ncbi:MAG: hypothetical protein ACI870_000147 [Crocinitomicaceae bacterium]|jgi:hypothetical protein